MTRLFLQVVCLIAFWLGRRTFASTSARGADITLTVDGKEVTVPQGLGFYRVPGWIYELFDRFCLNSGLRGGGSKYTQVWSSVKIRYL